jgi:hypothetical protein
VRQGGVIDEAIEGLFQCARHLGRAPGAGAIQQALGPLLHQALHPFAEGGMGHRERLGDGVAMVAGHDLPDRVRTAKAPRFLGLFEQGITGRQRTSGKMAFEGTQGGAPGERRTFVLPMTCGA